MDIQKYLKNYLKRNAWYREEFYRIKVWNRDAKRLGQEERLQEMEDKFHKLGFNHYQFTCKNIRTVEVMIQKTEDPKMKKELSDFKEGLSLIAARLACIVTLIGLLPY
jgi:hypothetical protein